jgi:hypothetical protein
VLLVASGAARADDDDDPAFAHPSATTQPSSPDDDDPGFVRPQPPPPTTQPAATQPTTQPATRPAVTHPVARDLVGIDARFAYRTFTLPDSFRDDRNASQRFHALAVEIYPISWWLRVGLSSQLGIQVSEGPTDWYATEGIVVGFQKPGVGWTPYLEGGVHVGLGTRMFYIPEIDRQEDHLTMIWAQSGELGVDGRLYQKLKVSFGVGVQHTSFYANGTVDNPLVINASTSVTFKIGLGY